MVKLRLKAIAVELEGDMPRTLFRGGEVLPVARILDWWRDTGCWWEGEGEKLFFRLLTTTGGIYEIFREEETGKWYLYKEYD